MGILDFFKPGPSAAEEAAMRLYAAVVRQSRRPGFYTACAVPDTGDGRFEMIVIHAHLILRRMREGPAARKTAQALYDHMFADMDVNLREMGAGDTGVAVRVKKMAEGLHGRIAAYDEGLDGGDEDALAAALARNLYRQSPPAAPVMARMAAYVRAQNTHLAGQGTEAFAAGRAAFAPAPEEKGATP
ncbi:MAG: ubiquinol-cytochrome C chaperone family protein [Rhodospirillales bacterium]